MFIPVPDLDLLPIPDPGSRGQKGTGSRIRIRHTDDEKNVCSKALCAVEEEQLLDSVMDCGHGNWSDIGNTNQGHLLGC
jgi:hypothetical protein